jgi:3-(3-hydroxy-phenyl)propionate hydroxylase
MLDGQPAWLIDQIGGSFCIMYFCEDPASIPPALQQQLLGLRQAAIPVETLIVSRTPGAFLLKLVVDSEGLVFQRYDAQPDTLYLVRPDQHVVARWRTMDVSCILAALSRATANPLQE